MFEEITAQKEWKLITTDTCATLLKCLPLAFQKIMIFCLFSFLCNFVYTPGEKRW